MIAAVRRTVLRVSSASMAQHSPAHAGAAAAVPLTTVPLTPVWLTPVWLTPVWLTAGASPAGTPPGSGQCTSPSGRCSRSGTRLPIRARSRRSLRQ